TIWLNGRQSGDEFLERMPLDRVWEIHLAGGMELDGFWFDAHSGAIPDALYAIAEQVIPRLPNLGAIIFEIFPSFVPLVGLDLVVEQMQRLHALLALRSQRRQVHPAAPLRAALSSPPEGAVLPQAWEKTLAAVVTGQPSAVQSGHEPPEDPGLKIVPGPVLECLALLFVAARPLT